MDGTAAARCCRLTLPAYILPHLLPLLQATSALPPRAPRASRIHCYPYGTARRGRGDAALLRALLPCARRAARLSLHRYWAAHAQRSGLLALRLFSVGRQQALAGIRARQRALTSHLHEPAAAQPAPASSTHRTYLPRTRAHAHAQSAMPLGAHAISRRDMHAAPPWRACIIKRVLHAPTYHFLWHGTRRNVRTWTLSNVSCFYTFTLQLCYTHCTAHHRTA